MADSRLDRREHLKQNEGHTHQDRAGELLAPLNGADERPHRHRKQRGQQARSSRTTHQASASRASAFGSAAKSIHSLRWRKRSSNGMDELNCKVSSGGEGELA